VNVAVAKVMAGKPIWLSPAASEMLSLFRFFGSGGPMLSDVQFKDQTVGVPQVFLPISSPRWQGLPNDVDNFAAQSQQRCYRAWEQGWSRLNRTGKYRFHVLEPG